MNKLAIESRGGHCWRFVMFLVVLLHPTGGSVQGPIKVGCVLTFPGNFVVSLGNKRFVLGLYQEISDYDHAVI